MDNKGYYNILGVTKNASSDDIKKAYKKMAFEYHPDKNKNPQAIENFKKVSEAYQVLSDPLKKQQYDNPRQNFNNNFKFKDPFEIFSEMIPIFRSLIKQSKAFNFKNHDFFEDQLFNNMFQGFQSGMPQIQVFEFRQSFPQNRYRQTYRQQYRQQNRQQNRQYKQSIPERNTEYKQHVTNKLPKVKINQEHKNNDPLRNEKLQDLEIRNGKKWIRTRENGIIKSVISKNDFDDLIKETIKLNKINNEDNNIKINIT